MKYTYMTSAGSIIVHDTPMPKLPPKEKGQWPHNLCPRTHKEYEPYYYVADVHWEPDETEEGWTYVSIICQLFVIDLECDGFIVEVHDKGEYDYETHMHINCETLLNNDILTNISFIISDVEPIVTELEQLHKEKLFTDRAKVLKNIVKHKGVTMEMSK
mgnify:FL=1|tara:strand:- start:2455 stop:2931 length:477 start_codon:yes stop_codon:yes gene_type:complete